VRGRVFARCATAAILAGLAVLAAPAAAAPDGVVAEGLFNPRGITTGPAGRLLVAESGSGAILQIRLRGTGAPVTSTLTSLPAEAESSLGPVDVAVNGLGNTYVVMSGPPEAGGGPFGRLIRVLPNGRSKLIADIAGYQEGDPDPDDLEGVPEESNPNGLALLGGRRVLVADAAGNDLLLVDAKRRITTVARFKPEEVPWPAGLPFGPPPGTPTPSESVPTAVAVGPDGAWYVSELKGFPFVKGTSRIWRIEPGAKDATCDPLQPQTGPCRTVGTGFSSVIDLVFGGDGTMYVLEIVKEGLLSVEFFDGPPIGALWAVKDGVKTELAPGTLLFPGGVTVSGGSLYVTTGSVFGPDAGSVVRVEP
jgi:hypothetical protein